MALPTFVKLPLRWIKTLVPATLKQRYRNARELTREKNALEKLPKTPCDVSRLGRLDPSRLTSFWKDPTSAAFWLQDCPRVAQMNLPTMTGGVNPGDQRALYHLVMALRPRRILEIGTHIGCSTLHIALALNRLRQSHPSDMSAARLLSADIRDVNDPVAQPWKAYGSASAPRAMIERVGCGDLVRFEVADSLHFLRQESDQFDFIFLDGHHDAERVYQEIPLALKRLAPGGFILLHDYFPAGRPLWSNGVVLHGPQLAVSRFTRERAGFHVLPLGGLPWATKFNSNVTSLALMTT